MPETRNVAVLLIKEPPLPIREAMDEAKLDELAESMRAEGLHQAIGVVPRGDRYEVVYGHRRYMAARRLDWVEIECKVYEEGSIELRRAMLSENLYREDVTPAEEGRFFLEVMELDGLDMDGVAAKMRKSREYIEQRIMIVTGDADVLAAVRARSISFSAARLLNTVEDDQMRKYFLDIAVNVGTTFRNLDVMIKNWRMQRPLDAPAPVATAEQAEAQPVQPQRMECFLCGGYRDPYNMEYVAIHRACRDRIEAVVKESFEQAGK